MNQTNNNMDYIIIENATANVFTTCNAGEIENAIREAVADTERSIAAFRERLANDADKYPHMVQWWRDMLAQHEQTLLNGFSAVTWDEFQKIEREAYLSKEPKEITEKEWDDALNVLPPMNWEQTDTYSMFLMEEFLSGPYTNQYYYDRRSGKYYTAIVDAFDRSTWLDNVN